MENEKLNTKFNKGVEEIKNISMTKAEKEHVLKKILETPKAHSTIFEQAILSPWQEMYSSISRIHTRQLVYYAMIPCLFIVLSGGAVFASKESLPGNLLYPLKVNVVEPIHAVLLLNTEDKVRYESELAGERLIEAAVLANLGELDEAKEEQLSKMLENHADKVNKALDKSSRNQDIDEEIAASFRANMNAQVKILEIISDGWDEDQQEDKEIKDTKEKKSKKITDVAKINSEKTKQVIQAKEIKEKQETQYQNKKKNIEKEIERTRNNLDRYDTKKIPERTKTLKKIIEISESSLKQAKELIKEADEEKQKGEKSKAYNKLMDSEISTKEASSLLRSGSKIDSKDLKRKIEVKKKIELDKLIN